MDISRPIDDFMPKRSNGGRGGLWQSLGLLLLALTVASVAGVLGFLLLRLFVPTAPVYTGLIFGLVALVLTLQWIARRYQWIMPWYYLLPALLFLLTFTFFPVVLTVMLAFTDYAGIRNGELNVASTSQIAQVNGAELVLENIQTLNCEALRNGCVNVPVLVYASGDLTVSGLSLEGDILTISEPVPEGRTVTAVALELTDIGFRAEFPIIALDESRSQLTLGRTPPGEVDLEDITLRLNREAIPRTIVAVDENTLTLNQALETGLQYEAIARYNDFGFIGFGNFRRILSRAGQSLWPVLRWNIVFAVLTVLINTVAGVFIAVLLNNPNLRFRGLYRTLLIIPWALPSIITIQVWKGFLNTNFGAINRILALLDLPAFDWLGNPVAAKAAILLVNLWLGLPFMMTATLGALSAIPDDLYEAAKIDGASAWQRFWGVTAPLLRTALIPITLTGFAFNFNNFNIIYLLTGGGPSCAGCAATARSTDILISWAYNEAFKAEGGYAYGLGSAISLIIFIITIAVSLINFRVTGALKEESNT